MKRSTFYIILLLFIFTITNSCKKFIEQQEKNAIVDLVTKGQWRITGYIDHQTDTLTNDFDGYLFQFNENGTVYGVKFGQQTNGTWSADVSKKSITSNFPTATYPITLLNHTWTITDSYTDSVAAKTALDSSFNILNLHKN
ncbi:MAG TPA: hypothetical protein VFI33_17545 [Puia sp.]|nr:hypothetical protein [Puia sp.]